jgi:phage repressor protein C with HTH and peptisase S24 domain
MRLNNEYWFSANTFRHDWLTQRKYKGQCLLAIHMNDEGMRQTLDEGDLIVINTESTKPVDSGVFAINYEGELRIRRLIRDAGLWWLYCDNPDSQRYPRKQFIEKRCYIIGQIVHRQSEKI